MTYKLLALDPSGTVREIEVEIKNWTADQILSANWSVTTGDASRWFEFAVLFDSSGNVLTS